jgi:hypothetical protein
MDEKRNEYKLSVEKQKALGRLRFECENNNKTDVAEPHEIALWVESIHGRVQWLFP